MPQTRYADEFQPNFGIAYPRFAKEDIQYWTDEQLADLKKVNDFVEHGTPVDPVMNGWSLEGWREVMDNWKKYQVHVILGGNRCLRGDTLIYDPVLKQSRRIDSIQGRHHVYAFDGERMVIAEAEQPFRKGVGRMLEITLTNGETFVASEAHLVLTAAGRWVSCSELRPGFELCLPETTSGTYRPGQTPGARHCSQKASGSRACCRRVCRSGDAPPRCPGACARGLAPSLADAPRRSTVGGSISRWLWRLYGRLSADRSSAPGRTPSRSHAGSWFGPRAILGAPRRLAARFVGTLYRASCRPCKPAWGKSEGPTPEAYRQSTAGSFRPQSTDGSAEQGIQCSGGALVQHVTKVATIATAGIDVLWDMTVPGLHNYVAAGVIHHNSSKSSFMARLLVHLALIIPEARLRMFHVNDDKSVAEQQAAVWEALPASVKALGKKKNQQYSVQYSQKNGFVGGKLILPAMPGYSRGSEIIFNNYQQYRNDPQMAEGWWAHAIALDEEAPQKLFETLRYRLTDARGRLVLGFTTLNGWSPLVSELLSRTRTLQSRYSELLQRNIPVAQESLGRRGEVLARVYYFWTQDNPFIPYMEFCQGLLGRPEAEILARAHGIPTKSSSSPFPGFDESVHVIKSSELPWVKERITKDGKVLPKTPVTLYNVVDPSGSKPWFMIWAAVDPRGTVYVYREWPDITYGEWAEVSDSPEGKPGPAQKPMGWGYQDYVELIRQQEGEEQIYERVIDSRLGNAQIQGRDGVTTIINDMDQLGVLFLPAPGLGIEHGIAAINDKLAYDPKQPLTPQNQPKLYITEDCQQLIYAMKNYCNAGKDEACKDPVDCVRYLLEARCDYVDEKANVPVTTFSY